MCPRAALAILLAILCTGPSKAQDIDAFLDGPGDQFRDGPLPTASRVSEILAREEQVSSDAPADDSTPEATVKLPDMEQVKIERISSSGRSLIINRGSLEGLRVGQLARLYQDAEADGGELDEAAYPYVAEAEIIKVHRNYSFWLLREVALESALRPGETLLALRRTSPFGGTYRNRHTVRVGLADGQNPDLVSDRAEEYIAEEGELVDTRSQGEQGEYHLQTQARTAWQSQGAEFDEEYQAEHPVFFTGPARPPPHLDQLKSEHEKALWRYTAQSSVDKVNRLPLGLKNYYNDFLQTARAVEDSGTHSFSTPRRDSGKNGRRGMALEAIEQIESQGLTFSADMNDEELRRFFVDSGIKAELERQRQVFFRKGGTEVGFHYDSSLSQHAAGGESGEQGGGQSFSVGLEYPLGNSIAVLRDYSVRGSVFMGSNVYSVGVANAAFSELSWGVHGRWYFLNPPNSIKSLMPYVGAGWRWGQAAVAGSVPSSVPSSLNYFFLALPSVQLGAKYRFREGDEEEYLRGFGLGLNIQIQYEKMTLRSLEVSREDIDTELNLNQLNLGFGVSLYF